MISCLLIQVARNDTGLPLASSEVRIAGDAIELGRGAACQIYLPDHRVSLLHATIRRAEDGSLHLEAAPEALISVNGFVERAAELRPGTQVGIGPYLLGVRPSAEAFDLILSLETAEAPAESPEAPGRTPVTLSALGLSTRRLGLGLAAFILLAFFVLPMLPLASPPIDKWQAGLPVRLTESVNPGPLSAGHAVSGMKCSACHQRAFRGVTDAACTKCHERVSAHLSAHSQHADRLGETRCTHCHASHEGKADAIRDGSSRCVGCHKRVEGTVAEARDFGSSHPPFHLTVPAGRKVVRVREDEKKMPPEKAGLKFSHQVHLDKEGVSSPDGRTVLNCRDCHKLEESGMHFAPMEMEMTCQQSRCHRLRFADPGAGIVPHGSEREVMNRLRNFYADWLADSPARAAKLCAATATAGNIVRRTLDCAGDLAHRNAASSLFRQAGENLECALCHEITETEERDVPWKVAPVRSRHDWQPRAAFPHARHDTVGCSDCHDKADSKSSEDLSFPRIGKCRECHAGARATSGRIKSSCQSCHRFHRVEKPPS